MIQLQRKRIVLRCRRRNLQKTQQLPPNPPVELLVPLPIDCTNRGMWSRRSNNCSEPCEPVRLKKKNERNVWLRRSAMQLFVLRWMLPSVPSKWKKRKKNEKRPSQWLHRRSRKKKSQSRLRRSSSQDEDQLHRRKREARRRKKSAV